MGRGAADLLRHDLVPRLTGVGFDAALPACFVLEGLVHYLPLARLRSLLAEMASEQAARTVIASFIRTDMYESAPSLFVRAVQALREVPHLHLRPETLLQLGASCGFSLATNFSNSEQAARFAPAAKGRPLRLSQDVAVLRNAAIATPTVLVPAALPPARAVLVV